LPQRDAERAFHLFQERLSELKRRAVVVALLTGRDIPPWRRRFMPLVLGAAQRVFLPPVRAREKLSAPLHKAMALAGAAFLSLIFLRH
jgi:hypothetical protein